MTNTTTTRKPTQRDRFNELLALSEVQAHPELVEFINGRIAQLDKKSTTSAKKPTARQVENEVIANAIADYLVDNADDHFTITALIKNVEACNDLSNQRVRQIVSKLIEDGRVVREVEKRVAYFRVA